MPVQWYSVDPVTPDPEALARLEAAWRDAPLENLEVLAYILNTARKQVIAYAPAVPITDPPTDPDDHYPDEYAYWQLQQAVNLWNAGRVDGNGNVGAEGWSFTPRPLDRTIRQGIRPVDIRPHVL